MTCLLFHINYLLTGGIETVLLQLLKSLDPKKFRIILSLGYKLDELEILKAQIPSHIEVHYLIKSPALTKFKKKKLKHTITPVDKVIEEVILPAFKKRVMKKSLAKIIPGVDVIIDFDMTLAPFSKLFASKKSIAYCHFSLQHYWGGKKSKLDRLAARLNRYDKIIMLCDEMKADAAKMYPFLSNKLVRIYNAIDQKNIRGKAEEPTAGIERLPEEYIVSVGRLNETQKDFTTLIKGYAKCCRQYGIKEKLVIVGDGPDKANLQHLAEAENVADNVIFAGFQSNPYNWIEHAKAFVLCTKFEGLPTVLIEAHVLGKPIIATASPTGIKELLMDGEAGVLIRPGADGELCAGLYRLLQDRDLQKSILAKANTLVKQFDIKEMTLEFENMINS